MSQTIGGACSAAKLFGLSASFLLPLIQNRGIYMGTQTMIVPGPCCPCKSWKDLVPNYTISP
jgi:hypothetical protein